MNGKYGRVRKVCNTCDEEMEMSSDHGMCDKCARRIEGGEQW